MLVVMPFGGAAANDNSFGSNSYDQILLDLLAIASERYRVSDARAIGGISRGGFWAYHLGLRFPDQFVAIGGHSPFFDADHVPAAYNPLNLAAALSADTHLRLWLDRGANDYAAAGIEQMHVNLQCEADASRVCGLSRWGSQRGVLVAQHRRLCRLLFERAFRPKTRIRRR